MMIDSLILNILNFCSVMTKTSTEKCELLAEYFSSIFYDAQVPVPCYDFGWNSTIPQCIITPTDIEQRLNALDAGKETGPDGIPIKYSSILVPHLLT